MRTSLLYGIAGGVIIGLLQFFSITSAPDGFVGGILYYSPLIVFFAVIYLSVKKTMTDPEAGFKTGLKAGVLTSFIAAFIWGIGFFNGLSHIDIATMVKVAVASRTPTKEIIDSLHQYNNQVFFDRTKFWVIPNFLLGFVLSLVISLMQARRKAA